MWHREAFKGDSSRAPKGRATAREIRFRSSAPSRQAMPSAGTRGDSTAPVEHTKPHDSTAPSVATPPTSDISEHMLRQLDSLARVRLARCPRFDRVAAHVEHVHTLHRVVFASLAESDSKNRARLLRLNWPWRTSAPTHLSDVTQRLLNKDRFCNFIILPAVYMRHRASPPLLSVFSSASCIERCWVLMTSGHHTQARTNMHKSRNTHHRQQ